LPLVYSFLEVEPGELLVSAVKKAEEGEALIIRLWNISGEEVEGRLAFHRRPARAAEADLEERERAPLKAMDNHGIPLRARGCEIKTLRLSFA